MPATRHRWQPPALASADGIIRQTGVIATATRVKGCAGHRANVTAGSLLLTSRRSPRARRGFSWPRLPVFHHHVGVTVLRRRPTLGARALPRCSKAEPAAAVAPFVPTPMNPTMHCDRSGHHPADGSHRTQTLQPMIIAATGWATPGPECTTQRQHSPPDRSQVPACSETQAVSPRSPQCSFS